MGLPRDLLEKQPGLDKWAHIVAWRGSHSHGTASELIDIKKGRWSLDEVHREADTLFAASREAHIHSKLPTEPDRELISEICAEFVSRAMEESSRA